MSSVEECEVTVPNDTAAALHIQERILRLMEQFDFSPREVFGSRLAIEEALMNAYRHGNAHDPKKRIHIRFSVSAEKVRVEVRDDGPGFDLSQVPDCTLEENLDKPSGRGIVLMRAFMSQVTYAGNGNTVILEKRRGHEPADD